MPINDMLVKVEVELSKRIQTLRSELAPLEDELAKVRKALAAITDAEKPALLQLLEPDGGDFRPQAAYSMMTMKQLTLRALQEFFPAGATARDLLATIESQYGRTIPRSSFSPQLSRLREDGAINRLGSHWRLSPPKRSEPPSKEGGSPVGGDQGVRAPHSPLGRNTQSPRSG